MTAALGDDGVVRLVWTPGVQITADLARRSVDLVVTLSGGRHRPLMVDMSGVQALGRDARTVYSANTDMLALALVGQSPVVRVIANFALNVNRPAVPTRFCSTVDEAETWLRGFTA
jgi:hypothetical protein